METIEVGVELWTFEDVGALEFYRIQIPKIKCSRYALRSQWTLKDAQSLQMNECPNVNFAIHAFSSMCYTDVGIQTEPVDGSIHYKNSSIKTHRRP